jgi:uncharacterized delta-60 repeat protein
LAVQPDGKILLGGSGPYPAAGGASDGASFALTRFDASGHLDAGFGAGGAVLNEGLWDYNYISDIEVLADGNILAAGGQYNVDLGESSGLFALLRYLPDGMPDPAFGLNGIVGTSIQGDDRGAALVVRPGGKIVVVGESAMVGAPGTKAFALAQYDSDGNLDPSFGAGGTVLTQVGVTDVALGAALQPDGKLVVVGSAVSGSVGQPNHAVILRYVADGTLDAGFGNRGIASMAFSTHGSDEFIQVLVQPDSKLLAGGSYYQRTKNDTLLARFDASGSLDTTFAGKGWLRKNLSSGLGDYADGMILQADGKVLLSGTDTLSRFNSNGSLDRTFGHGGKVKVTQPQSCYIYGIALDPDGRLVAGGTRLLFNGKTPIGVDDMVALRFLP